MKKQTLLYVQGNNTHEVNDLLVEGWVIKIITSTSNAKGYCYVLLEKEEAEEGAPRKWEVKLPSKQEQPNQSSFWVGDIVICKGVGYPHWERLRFVVTALFEGYLIGVKFVNFPTTDSMDTINKPLKVDCTDFTLYPTKKERNGKG